MRKGSDHDRPVSLQVRSQWEGITSALTSGALRLQSIVDENFEARAKPVKHDKTAMLMLHWDESDMNVIPEVRQTLKST